MIDWWLIEQTWWWRWLNDWRWFERTNLNSFVFSLSHHQPLIDSLRKGQTRSFVRFHQQIFQFSAKGFFFDAGNSYVRPVHTAGTEIEYQSKVKIYQTETAQAPPKLLLISWCRFKINIIVFIFEENTHNLCFLISLKYTYSMFCVLLKDFSRYWLFLCFPQYLEPLEFSDKRSKWIFYLVIFIIIKIRPHGSPGNPSPKYCWSSEAEAPTKAQEGSHHLHPSWRSVKTLWKNGFVIGFFGFFRTR